MLNGVEPGKTEEDEAYKVLFYAGLIAPVGPFPPFFPNSGAFTAVKSVELWVTLWALA